MALPGGSSHEPGIVAVIPARGGSKSIPLKNLVLLRGKPLLVCAIEAGLACPGVDRVTVSVDEPHRDRQTETASHRTGSNYRSDFTHVRAG